MAVGNGYSSAQILAMQKDAIRRVNEMQRAAQEKLRQTQEHMGDGIPAVIVREPAAPQPAETRRSAQREREPAALPVPQADGGNAEPQPPDEAAVTPQEEGGPVVPENPLQGILSRLNLDGETVLLLLMLLILVNEGADSKLIMALVYILL